MKEPENWKNRALRRADRKEKKDKFVQRTSYKETRTGGARIVLKDPLTLAKKLFLTIIQVFMPKRLPLQHPDNRPHYTFIYSCPSGCYTSMRNAVEPQNTESAAPYCPQRFSRKDPCEHPIKKKHADLSKTFHCKECKKTFRYEMALHLHEEHCGNKKPKPFKCSDSGKCFTRRATLEHHQQHFHL